MTKYEIMCVFEPQVDNFNLALEEVKKKFKKLDIEITKEHDMGVKELSYEIDSHTHAYYLCFDVLANPEKAVQINSSCNLIKQLLRILVINKD